MASTYSPYLRLELIGTGEQTGTWGDTTNTNLGTLLDQAVAGTATVDVTLGDVTLTALNGASDQSRQAILKITGTPGAARNVIAPENSKWYLVSNDCGQTITLKGASTTGYAINDGETLLMFWDGTDFVPGSSTALGYTPVNKAGDTMSGALYLPSATPTLSTQAATKGYVDSAVSGAVGSNFVLKTGDTMTGPLVLPGAPTLSLQAATKGYVDGAISGSGFATQSWVTSQNYANTSTQSLLYYYTKTDSDSRYVSVNTQALTYYPLTSTVSATYATKAQLSSYAPLASPSFSGTPQAGTWGVPGGGFIGTGSYPAISVTGYGTLFSFQGSGNAYAATAWINASDARVKENVVSLTGALEKLSAVRPVEFSFKRDNKTVADHYGVIAQELESVMPNLVHSSEMDDGDVQDVKAVSYIELVPVLIKAIQELKAEVDALKAAQ